MGVAWGATFLDGNCPGGNFPAGNCRKWQLSKGHCPGGNCPGEICPRTANDGDGLGIKVDSSYLQTKKYKRLSMLLQSYVEYTKCKLYYTFFKIIFLAFLSNPGNS